MTPLTQTIHENIKCVKCNRISFTGRRYACLQCTNMNLCQNCYESHASGANPRGRICRHHFGYHPTQCILTLSDMKLYYGDDWTPNWMYRNFSFTCPFCGKLGLATVQLVDHCLTNHCWDQTPLDYDPYDRVTCPLCICLVDPRSVSQCNLAYHTIMNHFDVQHGLTPKSMSFPLPAAIPMPIPPSFNVNRGVNEMNLMRALTGTAESLIEDFNFLGIRNNPRIRSLIAEDRRMAPMIGPQQFLPAIPHHIHPRPIVRSDMRGRDGFRFPPTSTSHSVSWNLKSQNANIDASAPGKDTKKPDFEGEFLLDNLTDDDEENAEVECSDDGLRATFVKELIFSSIRDQD